MGTRMGWSGDQSRVEQGPKGDHIGVQPEAWVRFIHAPIYTCIETCMPLYMDLPYMELYTQHVYVHTWASVPVEVIHRF